MEQYRENSVNHTSNNDNTMCAIHQFNAYLLGWYYGLHICNNNNTILLFLAGVQTNLFHNYSTVQKFLYWYVNQHLNQSSSSLLCLAAPMRGQDKAVWLSFCRARYFHST